MFTITILYNGTTIKSDNRMISNVFNFNYKIIDVS